MAQFRDRRTFLKDAGALAVSAAILGSSASATATPWEANPARITAVLYDERYSDCRSFADAFIRRGAMAFGTRDEIASLWYGPLRAHFARHRGSVAGLTAHSDLVVSQSCGVELSFRLLYEGSHDCRATDALTHRLRVRGNDNEIAAALPHSRADWARSLADALGRAAWNNGSLLSESPAISTARSDGHPGFLSSWILGPAMAGS
jgi:hypothetical protein